MSKRGRPPKWKRCPMCTRKKLIEDDFYHWTDKGTRRTAAVCKVCYRARRRVHYEKLLADPYTRKKLRERQRAWAQRVDKRENSERCKRYREKLKRERPEVYQQQLEDARIRARIRNERLGKPIGHRTAVVTEPDVWDGLPTGPLIEFLNSVDASAIAVDKNTARIALRAKQENRHYVTTAVADRVITAYGGALSNVYPDLYA